MKNIAHIFDSNTDKFSRSNLSKDDTETGSNVSHSHTSTVQQQVRSGPAAVQQQSQNSAPENDETSDLDALLRPLSNKNSSADAVSKELDEIDQRLCAMHKEKRGAALSRLARLACSADFSADLQGQTFAVLGKHLSNSPPRHCLETLAFLANGLALSMPSKG
ncbi:MAG: hypothetical protein ACRD5H_08180, partial [Nitrososphaerales archaeon]